MIMSVAPKMEESTISFLWTFRIEVAAPEHIIVCHVSDPFTFGSEEQWGSSIVSSDNSLIGGIKCQEAGYVHGVPTHSDRHVLAASYVHAAYNVITTEGESYS